MSYSGAGAIWTLATGQFEPVNRPGDATGITAAQGIGAGLVQLGPGLEALSLGTWGGNISVLRVTATGIFAIGRLHVADGTDPTKLLKFDASAITTGTTRTGTIPNWSGVFLLPTDFGSSGQFLKSNGAGTQPTWSPVTITNALLDGSNHTDTLAGSVATGDLIFGNGTPKWARLGIGTAGQVLAVIGGVPTWTGTASGVQHDTLAHLKPFTVANCTWNNGANTISTTAGGFANVKVGDFINLGNLTATSTQGARVTIWTDSNNITVTNTNTGSSQVGISLIVYPGDHWDDTIALDTGAGGGLLMSLGRGTQSVGTPAGTFQEWRGPVRWRGHANGNVQSDFRVQGSTSTASPFGFCLENLSGGFRCYIHVNDLTNTKTFRIGDKTDASFFFFASSGKAYLDDSLMSVNRTLTVGNWAGRIPVPVDDGTAGQVLISSGSGAQPVWGASGAIGNYAPGSMTLADGQFAMHVKQLRLTGSQRLTMAGDSRFDLMD